MLVSKENNDSQKINVGENVRNYLESTIQRHRKHWVHKMKTKKKITQHQKTKIITSNPPNTVGEPRYSQTVNSYCFVLWKTDFNLSNGIYVDIMKLYLYL